MSFTIFTTGTLAFANEVDDNFYHIFDGDILPRGGLSLSSTSGVYDIGASTCIWDGIYVNNIDYTSGFTITNIDSFRLIGYATSTGTSSSIEITGLNGDNYNFFNIDVYFNDGGSASSLLMYINSDSTSTYIYSQRNISGATSTIESNVTSSSFLICETTRNDTTTSIESFSTIGIKTKLVNGVSRGSTLFEINSYSEKFISRSFLRSHRWSGTSSTITSLKFIPNGSSIGTGTTIYVWGN